MTIAGGRSTAADAIQQRCRCSTYGRVAQRSSRPAQPPSTLPSTCSSFFASSACQLSVYRDRQSTQRVRFIPSAAAGAAPAVAQQQQHHLRGLYTTSVAHASGHLKVSDLHSIYYEVHGNPHGVPAVVVHGGPGAGCFPNHARFFDLRHYRVILLDQRGCGRSTPVSCLADNTTAALVGDLELLRQHLGVQQWLMLGGSWGVALSIAYAQAHPYAVLGLILRGVCLMRPQEIQWMYGGGAAALKPLAWSQFVGQLLPQEQGNPLVAYYKRLLSPDPSVRSEAAKAWLSWEMAVGFSSQQELQIWDGQQWSSSPHPQQQQQQHLPPPPKPAGAAAAAAAAPAGSVRLHQLSRGPSLPAEMLAAAAAAVGAASGGDNPPVNLTAAPTPAESSRSKQSSRRKPAAIGSSSASSSSASSNSTSSNSTSSSTSSATGRQGVCDDHQQQNNPWVWGLPVQGFILQDPEVCQLVWQGLNHTGFSQQGFGAQALLEAHYSLHGAFLLEQPLLDHIDRIRHIPCIAVQGQADLVCPPVTAVDLSRAWPEMELRLVPGAGHSMYDPAIAHELVCATDRMRALLVLPGGAAAAAAAAAAAGGTRRTAGVGAAAAGSGGGSGGGRVRKAVRRESRV